MAEQQKVRNLKIKTGVVKRYTKEKQSYEKEAADQQKKIEKFISEGKDELFMRQQTECLKESELMVPEVQRRLLSAYDDLKGVTTAEQETLGKTEEFKQAIGVLKDAEAHLPSNYNN